MVQQVRFPASPGDTVHGVLHLQSRHAQLSAISPDDRLLPPSGAAVRHHGDDRQPHVQDESATNGFCVISADNDDNFRRDKYTVSSRNNLDVEGIHVSGLVWQLDDYTQTALTSIALPSTAPTLSQWVTAGVHHLADHRGSRPTPSAVRFRQVQLGMGLYDPPAWRTEPNIQDLRDLRDLKDRWAPRDRRARKAPRDPPARQERKVRRASPVLKVRPVRKVRRDLREKAWVRGSMLVLAAGTPPPAGYTYVGKYALLPGLQNPPQGPLVMFVYRKN